MPLSTKKNKLQLHLHLGILEHYHAKEFFADDKTIEAVYVIAWHPETDPNLRLHYIHRSDKTICPLTMAESIDNLVIALNCVIEYQENKKCLLQDMDEVHLEKISSKTGHIHQPQYIRDLVNQFEGLNHIYEFDINTLQLYNSVINAYETFLYNYCRAILTALDIQLEPDFYKHKFLSCLKYKSGEVLTVNKVAGALGHYLAVHNDSTILDKLEKGKDVVRTLLTDANLRCIIRGVHKLEWLLSQPQVDPAWYVTFNESFHTGKNPMIDYMLNITAQSAGLNFEKAKQDLMLKGTKREQEVIAALKLECQAYQKYLEQRLRLNDPSVEPVPLLSEPKKYAKRLAIEALNGILNDGTKEARLKISAFKAAFEGSKQTLSEHTDERGLLFLKRTAYILSSLFLGAGLIYSYATKGTFNFFKSKGELAAEKIEACLPSP